MEYLNDTSEFAHVMTMLKQVIAERTQVPKGSDTAQAVNALLKLIQEWQQTSFLSAVEKTMERYDQPFMAVFSFSESSDDLSQWRAYSGKEPGYCISFRRDALEVLAKRNRFSLVRCDYSGIQLRKRLNEMVDRSVSRALATSAKTSQAHTEQSIRIADELLRDIVNIAPEYKNDTFRNESEWRLVGRRDIEWEKWATRETPTRPIMYYPIGINSGDVELRKLVAKVTIGPTIHPNLAFRPIGKLLEQCGFAEERAIGLSNVPYRNW